ncbi:MAG: BON domain-containing protein [Myxococcales bacterium]|nr:BON domain-containing protein [Myxococcales bacterium]
MKRRISLLTALVGGLALPFATGQAKEHKEPTDGAITRALSAELFLDEGVRSQKIDVKVDHGIATLTGTVDNVLAKDRAVERARSLRGVRSVVDRIAVVPVARSDARIRQDIESALVADPAADAYDLRVTVNAGEVTLEGTVESYGERNLSEVVAKGVRGVRAVDNRVIVKSPDHRPDHEILHDINGRLTRSIEVDADLVEVDVNDGVVALTGIVGSAAEKARVARMAWTAGVKNVETKGLEVRSFARDDDKRQAGMPAPTDDAIVAAIRSALGEDPRVSTFSPVIEVENGVVTLTGMVGSLAAKLAAGDDARNTVGVWRVRNLLRVRPLAAVADRSIRESITQALRRDPYVERYEVGVTVTNGHAYLQGLVGTDFERDRAADLAENAKGVVSVQNLLRTSEDPTWVDDLQVKQDIEDELFWSPFVDEDQVEVSVENGVATLRGTVDTLRERYNAGSNALEGGAQAVINRLQVEGMEQKEL